jgi:hypothetical protein
MTQNRRETFKGGRHKVSLPAQAIASQETRRSTHLNHYRLYEEVCRPCASHVLGTDAIDCRLVARRRIAASKPSEINALTNILAKLGMNHTDRSKLAIELPTKPSGKSEEDQRWAELYDLG